MNEKLSSEYHNDVRKYLHFSPFSVNSFINFRIYSFFRCEIYSFYLFRRERKHFPVHKVSKRMTNTLRRIYKQNMQLPADGYPSAPEHQSSNSEISPESPVKSPLYAELDKTSQQTRAIIGLPINGNSTINAMNLRSSGQKKIRHRRIGSADLTFNLPPMPIDRRTLSETKQVKMVHTETQTDTMDLSADISICSLAMHRDLVAPVSNLRSQRHSSTESLAANDNGNRTTDTDTVDHAELCSKSNEQLAYDYMNSNEQLDIRESSDDDNLETLDRRVSQFFTENRLVHADNGNGGSTTIDSRALFNVMAARRSLIIGDKDQVTVISRSNAYKSTTNVYNTAAHGSRRGSIQDHNCNNDDGDDSWTDEEEGEDSDNNYTSLRRKR